MTFKRQRGSFVWELSPRNLPPSYVLAHFGSARRGTVARSVWMTGASITVRFCYR